MPSFLFYLLKVNVALLLFYLGYHVALRRLTFYHLNRYYLLFGILFSTLYPFIDITQLLSQHQELAGNYMATVPAWAATTEIPEHTPAFNYWQIPVFLFWLGAVVMAARLLLQFVSLYNIHAGSEPDCHNGIAFRQTKSISQAFTFWQTIYLNPAQHKREELEPILWHEQVHVEGWHTLDVLLAEFSTVFYWFNPGAWLMKKGIKENLEFIADQDVVRAGIDKKAYQYLLLKVTAVPEPHLAMQFSFPSLKNRISMLNKIPTHRANQLRLLVVLPIIAVLLLAFRSANDRPAASTQKEALVHEPSASALMALQLNQEQDDTNLPADLRAFLKRNPEVKHVSWNNNGEPSIIIHLKSGGSETYNLNDKQSIATAEARYGALPDLPPPPPPFQGNTPEYIPDANNQPKDYKAFLERNPGVQQVGWKGEGMRTITIYLKSGEVEIYNLDDSYSRTTAENKYGKLPVLPPPPPPAQGALPPPPPAPALPPPPPPAPPAPEIDTP